MIVKDLEVNVLVDDYIIDEDKALISAHGLSLLFSFIYKKEKINFLIDSGPSYKLLINNLEKMGIKINNIVNYGLTLRHFHHFNGFTKLLSKNDLAKLYKEGYIGKNLPFKIYKVKNIFWNENIFVINHEKGLIVILGCCVYGFEKTIKKIYSNFDQTRIYGIIGGLGLSYLDTFSLNFLEKIIIKNDIEIVLPLHSTSPKAREYLIKEWNAIEGGVGTRIKI